jgi:DNA-binding GntR family transcriptional regulator
MRQVQCIAANCARSRAESDADAQGNRGEAIRLSGEFHQALTRMHGNPIFTRLLTGLLPTMSLLMARFKSKGGQVCVAHRHEDLITALERASAPAAAEMRKHLVELERSLGDDPAPKRSLHDVFSAYRETPPTS